MTAGRHDKEALRKRLAEAFRGAQGPFAFAALRSVVENVPSYIAAVTPDGELVYMHRFAEGYSPEDLIGARLYDFLDAPSAEVAQRCIETVASTREASSFRCVALSRSPERPAPHYEIRVAPIIEGGELIALSLLATDVTEHTATQHALQTSQADLALAVEATGMGIWSWDARTNEVAWDDMVCRHFGLPPGQGATTYEQYMACVHPDDRAEVTRAIQRAMEETGTYEDLLHRTIVDGEIRWVLIKGHVITDDEGNALGLRGGVFDVTERRRIDLEMRERQKLASVGELAAGVAHNFNNMLTAIMGNLDALESMVGPSQGKHVEGAMTAAEAAADIVRDLSALTQPARPSSRRPMPVRRLADHVCSIVQSTFTKQVRFEVDLRLEPTDEPWVEASGSELEHAILNLCLNGRDAVLEANRKDPVVTMTVRRRPPRPGDWRHWLEICVEDNGIGMDDATRERIFEPFFTTKSEEGGTGLGLFTAYRTVTEHGGLFDVQSTLGEGSAFSILLPLAGPGDPESS